MENANHKNNQYGNADNNKQTVGLSHILENERRERKKAEEEEKKIHNRILYFKKQEKKVFKKMEDNKKKLEEIIEIRHRRQLQKKIKEKKQSMKELEQEYLRQQWSQSKKVSQSKREMSIKKLRSRNKTIFTVIKNQIIRQSELKKQNQSQLNQLNYEKHLYLQNEKKKGRQKIHKFFKNKNEEALRQYKIKIQSEKMSKASIINKIALLQNKQQQIVQRMQQSFIKNDQIKQIVQNGYSIDITQLKKALLNQRYSFKNRQNSSNSKKRKQYEKIKLAKSYSQSQDNDAQQQQQLIELNKLINLNTSNPENVTRLAKLKKNKPQSSNNKKIQQQKQLA